MRECRMGRHAQPGPKSADQRHMGALGQNYQPDPPLAWPAPLHVSATLAGRRRIASGTNTPESSTTAPTISIGAW